MVNNKTRGDNFYHRIEQIRGDRKLTPFLTNAGIKGSSVGKVKQGGAIPLAEGLIGLRKVENVSINWLLTGEGTPFLLDKYQGGTDFVAALENLLSCQDWKVFLIRLANISTLAFLKASQTEIKEELKDYHALKIVNGPYSDALKRLLNKLERQNRLQQMRLTETETDQICNGEIGTYKFVQFSQQCVDCPDLEPTALIGSEVNSELMRQIVEFAEQVGIEQNITLSSEKKAKLITAAYNQAIRQQKWNFNNGGMEVLLDML